MDEKIKNIWFAKAFHSPFIDYLTLLGHGGVCVSLYQSAAGF